MLRVAAKPSLKLLLLRLLPLKRALGFPHRPKDLVDCGASRRCVSQFHSKTRRLWASPRMLASGVCGQLVNIRGLLELRLPHRPRERRRYLQGEAPRVPGGMFTLDSAPHASRPPLLGQSLSQSTRGAVMRNKHQTGSRQILGP